MEDYNQRSWFTRNWPWVLPVGCCSGCLLMIVLFIGGIGATAFSIFNEFEAMSPTDEVLISVNKHVKAKEVLGNNIESKGFPNGNISVNNDDGEVKYSIIVMGDKQTGTLYVNGIRSNGKWIYEDLYIIIKESGAEINLLDNLPLEEVD